MAKSKPASVVPKTVSSKKSDKPTVSKSQKSGLVFPVARVNRLMKRSSGMPRVGGSAPVYMTAVLEYVTAELMEIAGQHTKQAKPGRKRITPEDIVMAVRGDPELAKIFKNSSVYTGDKLNKVSDALKPSDSDKKKKSTEEKASK